MRIVSVAGVLPEHRYPQQQITEMFTTTMLRGAVDLLHHEGKVEKQDRDMLGGLLDLRELQVSDVMIHRTEMMMINADLPPEELVREVLAGGAGPVRDIVVLNAAAALLAFDKPDRAADVTSQLAARVRRAEQAIDSGAAARVLADWVAATQRVTAAS